MKNMIKHSTDRTRRLKHGLALIAAASSVAFVLASPPSGDYCRVLAPADCVAVGDRLPRPVLLPGPRQRLAIL